MNEPILTTTEPCQLHAKHVPTSHINERHHVWPLGEGGPDIPENIIVVCATGHNSIHQLINLLKLHRGELTYQVLNTFSRQERAYATLGYQRLTRHAM